MALLATQLVGQQAPRTLTLDEAIDLARQNNPNFLSTANNQASADWAVREAYGSFLPSVTASVNGGYQAEGEVRRSKVKELTESLFGGDPAALVSHLVRADDVDPEELRRIRDMLDTAVSRNGASDA
jgi:outer membrane protein TolC